jgi:catechol 2,3-dioxygenase-like lactoylglutathione lyase family enzyme
VLETALYVKDLRRAMAFYDRLFGFAKMVADPRLCAYSVEGRHVLLLFLEGGTRQPVATPGGMIPKHDGTGTTHLAFAIRAEDFDAWQQRLAAQGVAVESTVKWQEGGRSIFFRDPDGHVLELATPGTWPIY